MFYTAFYLMDKHLQDSPSQKDGIDKATVTASAAATSSEERHHIQVVPSGLLCPKTVVSAFWGFSRSLGFS